MKTAYAMHLDDLLYVPDRLPHRGEVESLVTEALQLIPLSRLDLVTRVSHGIRTPLSAILGFREILREGGQLGESERSEFSEIIRSESFRLRRFVSSLRTFEHLRTNKLQLDRSIADAGAAVRAATEPFERSLRDRKIRLELPAMPSGVHVLADQRRLAEVLEHLIANALRVSPDGSTISISIRQERHAVTYCVADAGPGLPAEEVQRVFRPFNRLERYDDDGSELGLGLTIVRSIVELHDGFIDVITDPASGSRFSVTFPS